MNSLDDQQLLREYTRQRSEGAFEELVRRHIDFVYSAVLRMLPDVHLAQDATQLVFVALAQNASNLLDHPCLSGWLHRTARNLAAKAVRSEVNRQAREQNAAAMKELLSPESETAWDRIGPHLDLALGELQEPERDALILRYFERRSAREIGSTLGITEEAAQKRVTRALESLRGIFAKRGIAVGSSGLAALILSHGVQAAPGGLAATVAASAILAGTAVQTSATMALTKVITMTTIQKALIGTVLAVSIGGGLYQAGVTARLRDRLRAVETANARSTTQLQSERDALAAKVDALSEENERGKSNLKETIKLRNEVARLRTAGQNISGSKDPAPDASDTGQPTHNEIPKSSWEDAGLETPEAALKTRGWCVVNGNRNRFKESVFITDGARKTLEDMFVRMAEQSNAPNKEQMIQMVLEHKLGVEEGILMPMMAENQQKGYTSYKIVSDQAVGDDERLLQVETALASGASKREDLKLRRFGSDWKIVVDEDFIKGAH